MLAIKSSLGVSITLKEITDLLDIEHNKAMKRVQKLSEEPSFGTVEKLATVYNEKGQKVDTYRLSKKQAIAVAAKLNDAMLMKVINRLEELENNKSTTELQNFQKQRELLLALNDAQQATMDVVQQHEERVAMLEQTQRMQAWQERSLQVVKNRKVYEIANDDKDFASKLHRRVWQLFKKQFNLPRYNELPAMKYEQGVEFINNLTITDMVA